MKSLEKAALFYLQRYASSSANLERVLLRKVERSAKAHGTDPDEGRHQVRDILQKLQRLGLLNDRLHAEARARSLTRRGASERMVRMKLAREGVDEAHIERAIEELKANHEQPELAAALNYARRRRLGPYRSDEQDRQRKRERDLAALDRQGFSLAVALQVLDIDDDAALAEIEAQTQGTERRR